MRASTRPSLSASIDWKSSLTKGSASFTPAVVSLATNPAKSVRPIAPDSVLLGADGGRRAKGGGGEEEEGEEAEAGEGDAEEEGTAVEEQEMGSAFACV